jgi:putative phage-type endonuclease
MFIELDLEQGSEAWLQYRRTHITATDAAAIMGIDPNKTLYQKMKQKQDGTRDAVNEAMKEGSRLEPIARHAFIEVMGFNIRPTVGYQGCRDWQMASFDGITEDFKTCVELKCSKNLYEKACKGEIPDQYRMQVYHQADVLQAEKAYYAAFWDGDIKILEVPLSQEFLKELRFKEYFAYENYILKGELPELSDRDFELFEHAESSEKLVEYRAMCDQKKAIEEKISDLKEGIVTLGPQRNFILDGTKIYQTQNSSYDFEKMRADGINLECYKKLSKPFWMISPVRGKRKSL